MEASALARLGDDSLKVGDGELDELAVDKEEEGRRPKEAREDVCGDFKEKNLEKVDGVAAIAYEIPFDEARDWSPRHEEENGRPGVEACRRREHEERE